MAVAVRWIWLPVRVKRNTTHKFYKRRLNCYNSIRQGDELNKTNWFSIAIENMKRRQLESVSLHDFPLLRYTLGKDALTNVCFCQRDSHHGDIHTTILIRL